MLVRIINDIYYNDDKRRVKILAYSNQTKLIITTTKYVHHLYNVFPGRGRQICQPREPEPWRIWRIANRMHNNFISPWYIWNNARPAVSHAYWRLTICVLSTLSKLRGCFFPGLIQINYVRGRFDCIRGRIDNLTSSYFW